MIDRLPWPGKSALIIAHPGHELRVYHWLEAAEPVVLVLTDGSGSLQQPRLASTAAVLKTAGARCGEIYGLFSDAEIYAALLDQEIAVFQQLLERIAAFLIHQHIDVVAGDVLEGYNPAHDLCRYLINAATTLVQRTTGRIISNYDFPLVGLPRRCRETQCREAIRLRLDEAAWQRKWQAVQGYSELAAEVENAVTTLGEDVFKEEWLHPVDHAAALWEFPSGPPFYERHGERRCQEGVYRAVIRYQQHVKPVAQALWRQASGSL